ncbi:putative aminodeoxychorismate lyase [Anoxybacillus thermarum]|uniref:Putative aminodeoxychorismate lyase n=1 Tax=Anoxybacillus thermarum TaxID=404937 RepID=A0A0D0QX56_9BACL|nr:endolytic transglycosylase MltG [Anoxybacillus thermarum]KIQ94024.1 putative aminodeoxychorismate lyase [Anoxybacillus thermarum]
MLQEHEAKTVRKIVLYITVPLLLLMVAACIGLFVYIRSALQPVDPNNKTPIQVEIPIGSSVYTIANILEKNGVVKDATIFRYYVKFKNHADFQAGNYTFTKAMTFEQIVKQLKTGKVVKEAKLKITIPEGKQLTQIAAIMSQKTGYSTEDIMAKLTNRTYIEELMKKYESVKTLWRTFFRFTTGVVNH